jgi:heme-degrading monooxygenase HmoA
VTQVLQSGNETVGITSWETKVDFATYADSAVARELFTRVTPLFMGMPIVRGYEVKVNLWEPAATKRI